MLHGYRIRLRALSAAICPHSCAGSTIPEGAPAPGDWMLLCRPPWKNAGSRRRWTARTTFLFAIEAHIDNAWVHIGNAGLHRIDWKNRQATFGIALGEKAYWGQGYGTDATRTRPGFAFHGADPAPRGTGGLRLQSARRSLL